VLGRIARPALLERRPRTGPGSFCNSTSDMVIPLVRPAAHSKRRGRWRWMLCRQFYGCFNGNQSEIRYELRVRVGRGTLARAMLATDFIAKWRAADPSQGRHPPFSTVSAALSGAARLAQLYPTRKLTQLGPVCHPLDRRAGRERNGAELCSRYT
jgi:hypothetical protein